ncbi:hypothetical protein [Actibacterium sp. MT2.3-13A]|uniref:hypothetical protein n=1 Tax=Actibacterium sp. MT2.3-13A TaxID=2828332 RepID=UPI001BA64872|nr:hypothetical protein [Actibacterium sp. MT2.3-13A]
MRAILIACLSLFAAAAGASDWTVPARGSATRAALMDAIRPHAEWALGRPVEFVVRELRVAGDLGFAMLKAQRPGGVPIDMRDTPIARRGGFDADIAEAAELQVLYRRSGETWVAVHWMIGATDPWFTFAPLCREYHPVIHDWCAQAPVSTHE